MYIFTDVFSKDELSSDTYPTKVVDDVIYEFQGKYVVWKEGEVRLDGANASENPDEAPEEDGGNDESVQRGIDIILTHKLQDMTGVYSDVKAFKD